MLYFNGWLFEGYDDAKAALLSSILTALRDHKRFGLKLKESAGKLLKRGTGQRGQVYCCITSHACCNVKSWPVRYASSILAHSIM